MFHLALQPGEKPRRQTIKFGFGINNQQPNPAILAIEINHANPSALARTGSRPTDFPAPTGTGNDITGLGIVRNPVDEGDSFSGEEVVMAINLFYYSE